MNKDAQPQRKLADMFRDKITEKQTDIQSQVNASSKLLFFFFFALASYLIWFVSFSILLQLYNERR